MCGRYQFSTIKYQDLQMILEDAQRRSTSELNFHTLDDGEITPGIVAPVMIRNGQKVIADMQRWGWPGLRGGTIINARSETVCEKRLFQRSMAAQRCIIPAAAYYEWDASKHKYLFQLGDKPLYLAGIYDCINGINCFIILTTAPNESVTPIHDRMPLILTREQVRPWLCDDYAAIHLLAAQPPLLQREACDGQLRFDI